jgi:hypothetical protein
VREAKKNVLSQASEQQVSNGIDLKIKLYKNQMK